MQFGILSQSGPSALKKVALALAFAFSLNGAQAADPAQALFDSAKANFAARQDLARNETAIRELQQAEAVAQDSNLKYDILVLSARAHYWKGMHQNDNASRKVTFGAGQQKAEAAKKVNDDYAEAYYFAGINLARWAEANGIIESLSRKSELVANMEGAMDRDTRAGEAGESIDGYGPRRTLGRMYKKLPGIFGGSREKSLRELEVAVNRTNTPGKVVALNVVYFADTLLDGGSDADKARARSLLTDLVNKGADPRSLNPDRVPETVEELRLAQDLLAGRSIP
jgi:hypothetical protein